MATRKREQKNFDIVAELAALAVATQNKKKILDHHKIRHKTIYSLTTNRYFKAIYILIAHILSKSFIIQR